MTVNLDGKPRNGGRIRADAITDVERPWVELAGAIGVLDVCDLLTNRGVSQAQASGIAMWLLYRSERRRSGTAQQVSSRYRRVLASIGVPPNRDMGAKLSSLKAA